MKEVVKCCYNCKYFHFYSGVCEYHKNMPAVDLRLPCENFKEGENIEQQIHNERNKS